MENTSVIFTSAEIAALESVLGHVKLCDIPLWHCKAASEAYGKIRDVARAKDEGVKS